MSNTTLDDLTLVDHAASQGFQWATTEQALGVLAGDDRERAYWGDRGPGALLRACARLNQNTTPERYKRKC